MVKICAVHCCGLKNDTSISKDQFTEKQLELFRQKFNLFDTDHDGLIAANVLGTLIRSIGQNPTKGELKDIIAEFGGPNMSIDFNEFLTLLARQMKNSGDAEQLKEAFRIFDKEGNGFISLEDLRHIMLTLGEKMTVKEFNELVKQLDVNPDGLIDYEKLVNTTWLK